MELVKNPPTPPFYGVRVVQGIPLSEIIPYINKISLFKGQWGYKKGSMTNEEYDHLINTQVEGVLSQMIRKVRGTKLIQPSVVYGYFSCNSDGDSLIIYESPDSDQVKVKFDFPRQKGQENLCLADYFLPKSSSIRDVVPMQVVTVGQDATEESKRIFDANLYKEYLHWHGFSVELAEALAEYWHKQVRRELGIESEDNPDVKKLFTCHYHGCRYSFGYPACPDLEDQTKLFELLKPEQIGIELTEEFQMTPEQSTSAIIMHHPDAKYYSL